jgi:hypothetical protein
MTKARQALERFVRPKMILLTSYRRDGTLVGTPVKRAVNGQHALMYISGSTSREDSSLLVLLPRKPDRLAPGNLRPALPIQTTDLISQS